MQFSTQDNWIAAVGLINKTHQHTLTDIGQLSVTDAQAALNKVYGARRFQVSAHGTVHVIRDMRNLSNWYKRRTKDGKTLSVYGQSIIDQYGDIE